MSTNPLHCKGRSANRPQISIRFHMLLPSLVNTRRTLVNARASLVHTLMSCLRTICELPASRHSNNRPQISFRCQVLLPSLVNTRRTLVNARASLVHTLMSCLRTICELPASRHSNNRPQISFHFHMVLPSLVNARRTLRKRSCITRAYPHELPANNLRVARQPSLQQPSSNLFSLPYGSPISRKRTQTLVQRTYMRSRVACDLTANCPPASLKHPSPNPYSLSDASSHFS